jgi:hypothetical protein
MALVHVQCPQGHRIDLASRTLIRMVGGPIAAIVIHAYLQWESSIRKRVNVNTPHDGHG